MNINNFSKINSNYFSGAKIYQKNQENLQAAKEERVNNSNELSDKVEISFFQSDLAKENYNSTKASFESVDLANDYLQSAIV